MSSVVRALKQIEEMLEWEPEELDRLADTSGARRSSEREAFSQGLGVWSVLGERIAREYREHGFVGAIIYGELGHGKSTYSFKVAHDVFKRIGSPVAFKDVVFRYTFFEIRDLIGKLRRASWRKRIPVLVWDDAGVFGGAYVFFTSVARAKAISDVFKLVRSRACGVLMSTPSPEDLLRPLRRYESVVVHVVKADRVWSVAHGYKFKILPSGRVNVYKVFEEEFMRKLPDRVFEDYMDMRDRYVDYALDRLEENIKEETVKRMAKLLAAIRKVAESEEAPPEARRLAGELLRMVSSQASGGEEEDVEVELVE